MHRGVQGFCERHSLGEALSQIDADDLGIVVGVEPDAVLLVASTQRVIVGDVSVVGYRQIGTAVRPEGLGVA